MAEVTSKLLAAAAELLASEGLGGLSVRRVAEAAGCSTMAIYSHFGGKSGLFGALAHQGFERMLAAQTAAQGAAGGGPIEEIHAICAAQREVALGDPLRYRLMFGALTELGEAGRSIARKSIELLVSAIDRAASLGRLQVNDPTAAAEAVFAMCHGVISAELAAVLEPVEGRLHAAVDLALAGLR
jgi:AcrR family transcriptional regulator